MGPAVVVEADPVADDAASVLQRLESMPMHALLFQRPDHSFDHAVLLGAARGDEFLSKPVGSSRKLTLAEDRLKSETSIKAGRGNEEVEVQ